MTNWWTEYVLLCYLLLLKKEVTKMASQEWEEPNGNNGQSDSRLKNKKPPSLVIAIPPNEDQERTLTEAQVQSGKVYASSWNIPDPFFGFLKD